MAALANCRQKPGSAARASVSPDIRNNIRNSDGKHAATNRSLFAMSPLPRMTPIPLPKKVASPTGSEATCRFPSSACSASARGLRTAPRTRVGLSVFFFCVPQLLSRQRPRTGRQRCFWIAIPLPHAPLPASFVYGKTRRTLPAPTQLRHQSGQLCPPRMMPRAPQDGREVRRCYSSAASLLSAVRTRIERPIPSTSPHTSFPICGMSYAPHRCSCRLFKPDEYGRIRRKHG